MSAQILRTAIWLSLGVLQLTGCHTLDAARVRDDSARSFSGTLISRPEDLRYGRGGKIQGGVELAYERYRGDSFQDLGAGHTLHFDQGTINGPQLAHNEADIQHGHIAYNQLFNLGSHFQFEPAIGAAFDKIELTALGNAPGSKTIFTTQHNWGALVALTPRWMLTPYLGIESRFSVSSDLHGTEISGNTTSLVMMPSPRVAFKAGYYTRDHEFETPDGRSNFKAQFSGFSGNITLIF